MTLNPNEIIEQGCLAIEELELKMEVKASNLKQLAQALQMEALNLLPLACPFNYFYHNGPYRSSYKTPLINPLTEKETPPALTKTAYPMLPGVIPRDMEARIHDARAMLPGKFLQWALSLEPWRTRFKTKVGLYLGRTQTRTGRLTGGPYPLTPDGARQLFGYSNKTPTINYDYIAKFWFFFTSPESTIRTRTVSHKDVMVLEHVKNKYVGG